MWVGEGQIEEESASCFSGIACSDFPWKTGCWEVGKTRCLPLSLCPGFAHTHGISIVSDPQRPLSGAVALNSLYIFNVGV